MDRVFNSQPRSRQWDLKPGTSLPIQIIFEANNSDLPIRFCGELPSGDMRTFVAGAATLLCTLHFLCMTDGVAGAQGLFSFGDSYTDTGAANITSPPYGITWPANGTAHRYSDGHNQVDYLADLFNVPTPTPYEVLDAKYTNNGGVNFGSGGAGVTYAYGIRTLDDEVDQFEKIVEAGVWTKAHLRKSVALVNIAINDYNAYNGDAQVHNYAVPPTNKGIRALVGNVVDGIAMNLLRIQVLGIPHIMVANVVPGNCMPFRTKLVNNYTACVRNDTISNETILHNNLLEARVNVLNKGIRGADIIILNMTKAFEEIFHHGEKYGFEDPYKSCCLGPIGVQFESVWKICSNPKKAFIFDYIHPTQAGWKAVVKLYSSVSGYTVLGPKLKTWKTIHQI